MCKAPRRADGRRQAGCKASKPDHLFLALGSVCGAGRCSRWAGGRHQRAALPPTAPWVRPGHAAAAATTCRLCVVADKCYRNGKHVVQARVFVCARWARFIACRQLNEADQVTTGSLGSLQARLGPSIACMQAPCHRPHFPCPRIACAHRQHCFAVIVQALQAPVPGALALGPKARAGRSCPPFTHITLTSDRRV